MWFKKDGNQQHTLWFPFFLGIPAYVWQFFFLGIPLLVIGVLAVAVVGECGHFHGITGSFFSYFFKPVYGAIIARSLVYAVITATICLLLGYPLAYFLTFKAKQFKHLFLFLLLLPFCTNFLLHVYAWFFVLERGGVLNSILMYLGVISHPLHILYTPFSVLLMMVYYYLPFMTLPLYTALEKFDERLIEASFDLGATWSQTLRRVIIPTTFSGIVSGFFLVYVPAFGEFAIPELMGGDKTMFAGSVVSHFILGGATISYGAAYTIMSSCILVVSALCLYWLMRKLIKIF